MLLSKRKTMRGSVQNDHLCQKFASFVKGNKYLSWRNFDIRSLFNFCKARAFVSKAAIIFLNANYTSKQD